MPKKEYNYFEVQRKLKEENFVEYVREVCAGCQDCGSIDLKENMTRVDAEHVAVGPITDYLCSDCFSE